MNPAPNRPVQAGAVTGIWPDLPARQQPSWPDEAEAERVRERLGQFPPLVFAEECDTLRDQLAGASRGESFVLQAGECAETFDQVTAANIRDRVGVLLQMAAVLTYGAGLPVVKVGRIAGQFGKPRSQDTETRDGVELPTYRGDMVNGFPFDEASRLHDPDRMLEAYNASASTLNLVRAWVSGGYADLENMVTWGAGTPRTEAVRQYDEVTEGVARALRFNRAIGVDSPLFHSTTVFASHEALVLDYERPLTRIDSRTGLPYATSGHFLWAGERTRHPDEAHIDFLARVMNPVGVKLGPTTSADDVRRLVDRLDPDRTPGRLTFITRMGAGVIREALPPIVEAVQALGAAPLWLTDPMHGNTFTSASGHKTRHFDDVVDEVRGFFEVHGALGTVPGGVHVELSGNDVTECIGGVVPVLEGDLGQRYESPCDPRLNRNQSLELALLVAQMLRESDPTGGVS
ncbi:3-deoxy-D-arabinoheptulosonate-7-phosphate synthase [Kytococcus aerolatus]|uniref:Phospho-2-dehydro-3-deoxyheptonate aldolase n=1 Tax=Kytococcus aerolatus TaxID=592308 RepID=A0A212T4B1_9MICO|nr:3-deoxy-7-phosphoheptulonate synthase class II [Kytococcus aerolatus]SNC60690.1 3-deoxy-D-arabinoheptulosonate-7-phosphate synthase [Kytococcus aerolatus]